MADSQKYVATNVFDINNPNVLNGYIDSSGNYVPYATNGTLYVPITAGTSYTVSGIIRASQSTVVRIATFTAIPSTQTPSVNLYTLNQGDSITITAGNNENYLFVMFCGDSDYNAYGSVQAALTTNCANLHIDTYAWQHSLRKLTTATEAVENPLYSDGTAITAYTLKGNTVQSGTPTPSNPITISGVGNKTANLLNPDSKTTNEGGAERYGDKFPSGTYYIINNTANNINWRDGVSSTQTHAISAGNSEIVTTSSDLVVWHFNREENIMVADSSIAVPFEPYGYKIPISSGGVTTNIYLGSTQTARQIYKIEYTGAADETWTIVNSGTANAYVQNLDNPAAIQGVDKLICTHYEAGEIYNGNTNTGVLVVTNGSVRIRGTNAASMSVESFKAYLAQQYAAGTPVTVWYVLATPQTAAVNEPLMKIGTYADSISNATAIPTTDGANSITVDTTVQPSEFTATWTGWHNAEVKEKSENMFDTFISGIAINTETGAEVPSDSGFTSDFIAVDNNTIYSYSGGNDTISTCFFAYDSSKAYIGRSINTTISSAAIKTVTTVTSGYMVFANSLTGNTNPIAYIRASHLNGTQAAVDSETIMLNTGSTALPYEPYWK